MVTWTLSGFPDFQFGFHNGRLVTLLLFCLPKLVNFLFTVYGDSFCRYRIERAKVYDNVNIHILYKLFRHMRISRKSKLCIFHLFHVKNILLTHDIFPPGSRVQLRGFFHGRALRLFLFNIYTYNFLRLYCQHSWSSAVCWSHLHFYNIRHFDCSRLFAKCMYIPFETRMTIKKW